LVYSGDKDFVCNWRGGEAWTNNLEWSGKQAFNQANYTEFAPNGKSVGQFKEVENFAFLRVYDAGHM
jgi:cathepsin A (carboxypeptidase C)